VQSAIVIGQAIQIEIGYQPIQPARHLSRPAQRFVRHRQRNPVAARLGDFKHATDFGDLGFDLGGRRRGHAILQVVHL